MKKCNYCNGKGFLLETIPACYIAGLKASSMKVTCHKCYGKGVK